MSRRKRTKTDRTVSGRIRGLAGLIFILFGILLVRLVWIQVVEYNSYTEKKNDYTSIRQYHTPPRGQIYDRKGNVLAKTVVSHNIVYTSPNNMSIDDYQFYADRIVSVFDVDPNSFSDQDKKEAYMTWTTTLDSDDEAYEARNLLKEKEREQYDSGEMSESKRYALLMDRIGEDQIKLMSEDELKRNVIYNRMVSDLSTGQEAVIMEDVSDDDVAYLVEHKTEFPGFDVDFGGWKREYPYGETLSDVIGKITSSTEGLPADNLDYFLAKGYQRNAPVGTSGLELQYNDLLAGTEQIDLVTYDSQGLAQTETIQEGCVGYDIVISIDIDLQQAADEVVKDILVKNAGTAGRENFSSLFCNLSKPDTGEILALSGYQIDLETRQLTYYASGNYNSLVNPGSCIKGVTVFMGLSEGVMQPTEMINDEVMNIAGEELASYNNYGAVDARRALEVSSNIYMFNVAIRLAKGSYTEGQPLYLPEVSNALYTMRSYFSMFGLGNKTDLDIPNEVTSYMGQGMSNQLLNYSIGQLDMYSPIQLNQYISMVAEKGKMYQMHFFKYAQEVNSEEIVDLTETHLKNQVPEGTEENLTVVQEGMRACVTSKMCGMALHDMSIPVAAKTGTAEVGDWVTTNLVGFAPYDDPTVAFVASAPTSGRNEKTTAPNICSNQVIPQVLTKYFELYPQGTRP